MPRKAKSDPDWDSEFVRHYQAMRLNGMTVLAGQVMWNELQRERARYKNWRMKGKKYGDKHSPLQS